MSLTMPTGLSGCVEALHNHLDSHEVIDAVTTLAWLRLVTDPACPLIGGHDPRAILDPPLTWDEIATVTPALLDVLCWRLNQVMGEPLLQDGWAALDATSVARAMKEIGRWQMPAGDPLGVAYTHLISRSKASAIGSFFTPYEVSLMMAMMTAPAPGESVMDPCCGSGGMLLAALESVRTTHGHAAVLEVYGCDIDPAAVRLAKLNLALAGIAPNHPSQRLYDGDTLDTAPPAIQRARSDWEAGQQGSLFEGA